MKAIIVYPLPFDAWSTFERYAHRFVTTFKECPPGVTDYEVWAMCCLGLPSDQVVQMFYGINTVFVQYNEHGCDIGSAQYAASLQKENTFILAMTSRCYFFRPGWLSRYLEARLKHGPGLYGASGSFEGGTPHVCTRAYGMDSSLWNQYPHKIDTREKGQKFEVDEWCVTSFVRGLTRPTLQVTWEGERPDWRNKEEQHIYRRNDQSAMLVWDKHTDYYRDATATEKIRLERMADGEL